MTTTTTTTGKQDLGSILVFGAHPDDLEIGMAGTIAKLSRMGYNIKLVIAVLPSFTQYDKKEERKSEAIMSSKVMGVEMPDFLDLTPDEMIHNRKLIGIIDRYISEYKPIAVFTQWIGDSHQDHQILTKSVISGARDTSDLYMYETTIPGGITEHSFRSQLFIDISDYLDIKTASLHCFQSQETRCGPLWVDAIIGRAAYRGYQMNCKFAECFEVIRTSKW
ncbi:MAG TPA: PIG-L family deacetylase [Candidatus Sulfopaludibacter sp.]|jgi:N-acetylglucosamine malate deacetylase 1|nr:PIG-L family deacetylase [Candidatus Sulfopaludibacter sp.]